MKKNLTKFSLIVTGALFSAVIAAFSQPAIIIQPQNRTNVVGTTAMLWVEATGTPPLAYQWQRRGAVWSDLAGCTVADLCLTNVQASHGGDYRVIVTNLDGAVTSDVACLTILIPPQITRMTSLQHQAVHLDSNALFAVSVSGTAPLSYEWRLDGVALPGQTSNRLDFSAVQPADEGDYTVMASNMAGTVTSEPARLWVVPPPSAYIRGDFTNGSFRYPYYYLMPTNYNPARSYPLVWIFHGAYGGEIAFTNGAGGPPGWLGYANYAGNKAFSSYRQQETDPVIVVWPTLRAENNSWGFQYVQQATNLLDHLISRFNVDTNRVYLVGGSAGVAPARDLAWLRRGFFAGGMLSVGSGGGTPASATRDVPFWVACAQDDEYGALWDVRSLVAALRQAGGRVLYTEYVSGGHLYGSLMSLSTPAAVDWLLAQRRGVISTEEPFVAFTNSSPQAVLFTGATNLTLTGTAAALGRAITKVSWTNYANYSNGVAAGSNFWCVADVPLVVGKTNFVTVVATTTSWAPAFGGNTTFNGGLCVVQAPLRATLSYQRTNAVLNWTGSGPPYRVQRATDLALGDWTVFSTNAAPPLILPLDGSAAFYRVIGE